jgi:hypothetical protein
MVGSGNGKEPGRCGRRGRNIFCLERDKKIRRCARWFSDYVAGVDWQQTVSLMIVAGAAGALLWSRFSRRKAGFGCDTLCGCSGVAPSTQSSIVFRARKAAPSQVVARTE